MASGMPSSRRQISADGRGVAVVDSSSRATATARSAKSARGFGLDRRTPRRRRPPGRATSARPDLLAGAPSALADWWPARDSSEHARAAPSTRSAPPRPAGARGSSKPQSALPRTGATWPGASPRCDGTGRSGRRARHGDRAAPPLGRPRRPRARTTRRRRGTGPQLRRDLHRETGLSHTTHTRERDDARPLECLETSAMSSSRPTNDVVWSGRFVAKFSTERSGGKSCGSVGDARPGRSAPRADRSRRRCSPRSTSSHRRPGRAHSSPATPRPGPRARPTSPAPPDSPWCRSSHHRALGHTGVHAHPHPQRLAQGPALATQRQLAVDRRAAAGLRRSRTPRGYRHRCPSRHGHHGLPRLRGESRRGAPGRRSSRRAPAPKGASRPRDR